MANILRTCCKTSTDIWKAATKYINDIDCTWVIHEGRSIVSWDKNIFGYYNTIADHDYFFGYYENDTRPNLNGFDICGNYEAAIKLQCNDIYGSPVIQRVRSAIDQRMEFFVDAKTGKAIRVTYEDKSIVDFEMLDNYCGSSKESNIFVVPNMMELLSTSSSNCDILVKFDDSGTIEAILCYVNIKRLHRNICFIGFKNE